MAQSMLDVLPRELADEIRWRRARGYAHSVALDLRITGAVRERLAFVDPADPHAAALEWLALREAAELGRRRSRPTREAEAELTGTFGRVAGAILAAWPADGPPLPDAIRHAARRQELYEADAEARSDLVATPYGPAHVHAVREANSAVWHLVLAVCGTTSTASGYAGVGILSARSVRVEAMPLYDADGRFWGVEARATFNDRARTIVGAEWRLDTHPATRPIRPSQLGLIADDRDAVAAWPAITPDRVRQGDAVYVRRPAAPGDLEPDGDDALIRSARLIGGGRRQYSAAIDSYGAWIVVDEGSSALIEHPDHPTVRLSAGAWHVRRCSRAVRPEAVD